MDLEQMQAAEVLDQAAPAGRQVQRANPARPEVAGALSRFVLLQGLAAR